MLNVGNGWEWGLLGWLLIVSQWIIPENSLLSTSKMIRHCKTWNIIRHCKTWSNNIKHYKHSQFPISGGFPLGKISRGSRRNNVVIPSCWLTIPIDHISLDLPITANQLLNQLWHPKTWDTSTQKLEMMCSTKNAKLQFFLDFLWFSMVHCLFLPFLSCFLDPGIPSKCQATLGLFHRLELTVLSRILFLGVHRRRETTGSLNHSNSSCS